MKTILSVILAVIILLVMILVHEFGHYVVGKIFKFKINEFAIGFGPALFKKKKKNGEVFSIRAIPLGGFCAFEGEDEENSDPNAFNNKKPWQRILVLFAGAFMNFVLAFFVIVIGFSAYGQYAVMTSEVVPVSEYENYSIQNGDILYKVGGKNVFLVTDLVMAMDDKKAGQTVNVTVIRQTEDGKNKRLNVPIVLREDCNPKNLTDAVTVCKSLGIAVLTGITDSDNKDESKFLKDDYILRVKTQEVYEDNERLYTKDDLLEFFKGLENNQTIEIWVSRVNQETQEAERVLVSFTTDASYEEVKNGTDEEILQYFGIKGLSSHYRIYSTSVKVGFFQSIGRGFVYAFKISGTIFRTLGELITGSLGINNVGGPVTTIKMTSQMVSYGFEYFLEIMAYIGVNLAVFNLLPIPALDGSKIIFTIIEWIRKKPINRNVEAIIHAVGFVLLFGFAILVDLLKLF